MLSQYDRNYLSDTPTPTLLPPQQARDALAKQIYQQGYRRSFRIRHVRGRIKGLSLSLVGLRLADIERRLRRSLWEVSRIRRAIMDVAREENK